MNNGRRQASIQESNGNVPLKHDLPWLLSKTPRSSPTLSKAGDYRVLVGGPRWGSGISPKLFRFVMPYLPASHERRFKGRYPLPCWPLLYHRQRWCDLLGQEEYIIYLDNIWLYNIILYCRLQFFLAWGTGWGVPGGEGFQCFCCAGGDNPICKEGLINSIILYHHSIAEYPLLIYS